MAPVYAAHDYPTTYAYNTLNQVSQQYTPDADTSHFWYGRIGRLAVSQNAEQYKGSSQPAFRYSYTLYDAIGRTVEVGEKSEAAAITSIDPKNDAALQGWLSTGQKAQVTRTLYDGVNTTLVTDTGITHHQKQPAQTRGSLLLPRRSSYTRCYFHLRQCHPLQL